MVFHFTEVNTRLRYLRKYMRTQLCQLLAEVNKVFPRIFLHCNFIQTLVSFENPKIISEDPIKFMKNAYVSFGKWCISKNEK